MIYEQWLQSCLDAGISAISTDTCARVAAIMLVHTPSEVFTHNAKAVAEAKYIQKRFQLYGTGTPPPDFVRLLRGYVQELKEYAKEYKREDNMPPSCQWAVDLFKERYNIEVFV